ncbi:hypothetical protein ACWOAH_06880 [Vagococcus vulneris]|uniref:Uncharacterized protein n=1 Tax=Vagococcus vulneris TaxID=1977869 RepID=A0A429ZYB4_9ENTE|nr:hypothetical protein [Vagococcus vulneris]RST98927.1 hypothetical protein CBF37_06035 [Vagococcus vulneris]
MVLKKIYTKKKEQLPEETINSVGLPNDWAVLISSLCLLIAGYLFSANDIYSGFSKACFILVIIITGTTPVKKTWQSLRQKQFNVYQLVVLIVIILLSVKQILWAAFLLVTLVVISFIKQHVKKEKKDKLS